MRRRTTSAWSRASLAPPARALTTTGSTPSVADSSVKSLKRLYGENFLVDESLWTGRAVGMPFGLEGRNRPLEFRLLHVLEFADDGSIKRENCWLDLAAIQQQLPQD